jgi:ketosteroid isomerase-like protein
LFPLDEDSVSEGDTRAIVRELYDAYGRRDFERVAALIHDDIDWVIYAPMSVFPFADRGTDAPRFWRRWPTLPRPLRSKLITRTS